MGELSGRAGKPIAPVKPYIEYWVNEERPPSARGQDSAKCKGGSSAYAPGFSQNDIQTDQRPNETKNETYSRFHHEWERCMLKSGYRYTGQCYGNEVSRASLACGAR